MQKVVIIGAGGHAKVIVDILQQNEEYEVAGLVDNNPSSSFWNIPVLGNDDDLEWIYQRLEIRYAFVALGNGKIRERVTKKVINTGFQLINVISKYSIISDRARLGKGIVVMPGAIINADVQIADNCIINTNASIDHDGKIGGYTHIAPGCAVSGYVTIGKRCLLGTGSRVIDRIEIGDNTIVGAGAVVVKNIEGDCTVVGVPARMV